MGFVTLRNHIPLMAVSGSHGTVAGGINKQKKLSKVAYHKFFIIKYFRFVCYRLELIYKKLINFSILFLILHFCDMTQIYLLPGGNITKSRRIHPRSAEHS